MLCIFGGEQPTPDGPLKLADTWIWSDGTWNAQQPDSTPLARVGAAAAFDQNLEQVILFGGFGDRLFSDTWTWDGTNWQIVNTDNAPPARMLAGLTYHPGLGGTILFGGIPRAFGPLADGLNDIWLFDGADWRQLGESSTVPPGGDARSLCYCEAQNQALLYTTTGGKIQGEDSAYEGASWLL